MTWQRIRIRAPHLKGGAEDWINVDAPLTMEELVGDGVVLVDFWDYTCVNCIRTLPYLIEWHERYAPLGLTIVGIHTPEFAFAQEREAVEAAVDRLGIPYPVLLDNEQANWSAFANRTWPTKYLIDS
ncbi:MAG: redoxin domain-containing protein, partial [Chloroflexota bacterium]|nr:redoxin domain-containing protein [Chloroflexota bacterium]